MSKLEALQNKADKIKKDISRANELIDKQKEIISTKESDLERVESEMLAFVLVQNDMEMNDLIEMLKEKS